MGVFRLLHGRRDRMADVIFGPLESCVFRSIYAVQSRVATFLTLTFDGKTFDCTGNRYNSFRFLQHSPFQINQLHSLIRPVQDHGKTNFYVEPVDKSPSSDGRNVSDDAEMICKILAEHPNSEVGHFLDQSGVLISNNLVIEVLKRLGNAGILSFFFFQWADKCEGFKHSTECYHHLIEALGKIKQFKLIWNLVDTMRDRGLLSKTTFGLISRRYARAKMIKESINTFKKIGTYGLQPDLSDFNHLIDTISKSKNVKTAQKLVYEMKKEKKFFPDLKTYTILMEGWGYESNISRLTEVYREMMEEGFQPDHVTYGILVNAFCKARKLVEAIEVFNEMKERNIKPTPHVYCNLINGLGADKRLNDALKYFQKFCASGFPPELPTYNAVVGAYCWVQKFECAYKMLDDMKMSGVHPNSRTYDVILNHLIRSKKTEEAFRLFRKMKKEDGCEPGLNTYTMIVRMFCVEGKLDMALEVWSQMTRNGILPCLHMFMVVINRFVYESRLEEACKFFEDMLDKGIRPPGQLYSNLIQSLQDGGKNDWARKLALKLDKLRNATLIC